MKLREIEMLPYEAEVNRALRHGEIVMANESLFNSNTFSEALSHYAVGWRDQSDLEAALEFYAPAVQVADRFEYSEHNNAEDFLTDIDDDARAPYGDFKTVENRGEIKHSKVENRGLRTVIDLDLVRGKKNWKEEAVARLLGRLKRSSLRRAIALLSAAATNDAVTWDDKANPDGDVRRVLRLATDASGLRPNRVGFGEQANDLRLAAYEAQNTAGATTALGRDGARLAAYYNVSQVHYSVERYQSGVNTKAELVGALVLLFNALSGVDVYDPSNIKRFWAPCVDGSDVRVYERELGPKLYEIVVEKYELIKVTSMLGIRKLTVSAGA